MDEEQNTNFLLVNKKQNLHMDAGNLVQTVSESKESRYVEGINLKRNLTCVGFINIKVKKKKKREMVR